MKYTVLLLSLLLAACDQPSRPDQVVDQCLRREIFQQCMAALPAGPQSTSTSNDWDEVVEACERASYHQAIRARAHVKPECLAE